MLELELASSHSQNSLLVSRWPGCHPAPAVLGRREPWFRTTDAPAPWHGLIMVVIRRRGWNTSITKVNLYLHFPQYHPHPCLHHFQWSWRDCWGSGGDFGGCGGAHWAVMLGGGDTAQDTCRGGEEPTLDCSCICSTTDLRPESRITQAPGACGTRSASTRGQKVTAT